MRKIFLLGMIVFGLFILVVVFFFLRAALTPVSSGNCAFCGFKPYEIEFSYGKEIENDQAAFNILKEGSTYDPLGGIVWVEDHIPFSMTAEEALNKSLLFKGQTITLDSGKNVSGVWIFGPCKNKALDKQGNLYYCQGLRIVDNRRTCQERCEFKGFSQSRCGYRTIQGLGCLENETKVGTTTDCEGGHSTEKNLYQVFCCQ
jgi:hypothetical protein